MRRTIATGAGVVSDLSSMFEEVVRSCFGNATRISRTAPLAGDASTRRYIRLWLDGGNAPASAVAMILTDRGVAMASEELAVFKESPQELPYLNVYRFLHRLGVAIPLLYADASEQGLLLLEDVGDTSLWQAVQHQPEDVVEGLYRRAIDQLLLIQIGGTCQRDDSCLAFQQAFDERLFRWEFEHFIEYGIERRLGHRLPDRDAAVLREHFGVVARRLAAEPRYLNHRDFHSWNLFVQDGTVRVIDFQDALLAPNAYDLATLLGDRDTPEVVRPHIEHNLLVYYERGWKQHSGQELDPRRFEELYYLCALQKALKVVGRFYFLEIEKKKPGYLRYIPSTVRQIERILPRFPDLLDVAGILRVYLHR
jgi:aminoglycoside/choline kinase family phosphotransferase